MNQAGHRLQALAVPVVYKCFDFSFFPSSFFRVLFNLGLVHEHGEHRFFSLELLPFTYIPPLYIFPKHSELYPPWRMCTYLLFFYFVEQRRKTVTAHAGYYPLYDLPFASPASLASPGNLCTFVYWK